MCTLLLRQVLVSMMIRNHRDDSPGKNRHQGNPLIVGHLMILIQRRVDPQHLARNRSVEIAYRLVALHTAEDVALLDRVTLLG